MHWVIFRPSEKTDPRAFYISVYCGIPNAVGHLQALWEKRSKFYLYFNANGIPHAVGHLQALWENRSKSYLYFNAFGIPQCIEI